MAYKSGPPLLREETPSPVMKDNAQGTELHPRELPGWEPWFNHNKCNLAKDPLRLMTEDNHQGATRTGECVLAGVPLGLKSEYAWLQVLELKTGKGRIHGPGGSFLGHSEDLKGEPDTLVAWLLEARRTWGPRLGKVCKSELRWSGKVDRGWQRRACWNRCIMWCQSPCSRIIFPRATQGMSHSSRSPRMPWSRDNQV